MQHLDMNHKKMFHPPTIWVQDTETHSGDVEEPGSRYRDTFWRHRRTRFQIQRYTLEVLMENSVMIFKLYVSSMNVGHGLYGAGNSVVTNW